jgi:tetratricopeptide (TPR) repeat protein
VFSSVYLIRKSSDSDLDAPGNRYLRLMIQAVPAVLLVLLSARAFYEGLCYPSNTDASPVADTEYVRSHFPSATIGNNYTPGSYLLWSLWPATKVFIDSRGFPYKNWYPEYDRFSNDNDPAWKDLFLRKYACDVWFLTYDFPQLGYFIKSPNWQLVYYGQSACVFLSRRMQAPERHVVSDSIDRAGFFDTLGVSRFAISVGDVSVSKRLLMQLKPLPFCRKQKVALREELSNLGDTFFAMNKDQDALDVISRALEIDPHSALDYFKKGNALARMGRLEEAIAHYHEAIRIKPDLDMAHNNLANTFMLAHKPDEAIREYTEALRINPGNSDAAKNLAIARQGSNVDEAISGLKEKLKADPHNTRLLTTMGQYYAQKGDYQNALVSLKQVLELTPEDPSAYYNISCIYARLGKVDESVMWLDRAVKKGFKDWALMKQDHDLDPIRDTEYYRRLMESH